MHPGLCALKGGNSWRTVKPMMLAAMSEAGWIVIAQAAIAAFVTVAMAWVTKSTARTTAATLLQSDGRQNVSIANLQKVATATHILVNNNMAIQLRENAELRRWKAAQTKDPLHVREAEVAERLYREHQLKQATVDAQADQEKAKL